MKVKETNGLIKRGRDQGFLTQDEILEVFNDAENRLNELDDPLRKDSISCLISITVYRIQNGTANTT